MKKQPLDTHPISQHKLWGLSIVMLAGIMVTIFFFWMARNAELNQFESQFEHDASLRANLIAGKLEQCLLAIQALQGCYNASDFVERREFTIFTAPFLAEGKELQALEWVPCVFQTQRVDFNKKKRQEEGVPDFQIKERDANGDLVPAGQREVYYPVEYVEPLKINEKMIGFDLGSEPLRLDTLKRARDTGGVAVSGQIQLMQEDRKQSGFIVALPVYQKNMPTATVEERRAALEGFTVGIFWAGDTLASAMDTVAPEGLLFELIDLSAPKERQLIHHWTARVKPAPSWRLAFTPPPPHHLYKWDFADRQWAMYITPNSAYMIHHYQLDYWLILPVGFGLTIILGSYLWAMLSQRGRMERMVLVRTAELRHYQENLEGLVKERAAELSQTNESLKKEVAERRRAQETLHLSEERLRAMYECSNDAIMLLTEKGFFDCNPRTLELFGFKSKEEFINIHPADISPPTQPNGQESLPAAQERIQTAYREGINHFEWVHCRKNGEDFPAEVLLTAFDYGGKRVLQATVRDITARKRAEAELKKLSVAVEQNPAIIVITDREGNIEYVNPKFSQTAGYTLDEARGKNPRILKSGKTTPEEYQKLWDTILSGREWRGVFYNKKKNGAYYYEQALIAPIKNEMGRITNFIAIKEDITDRKRDEEALGKALNDLEQANRELQKADKVKDRFLASISHEIRTPLNAIIGMTGLLLDTKLDAEQQDCAETVRTSGEMLLALINNILDFSKLEAEKMDLENQPFDLRRCIEESLDLINPKVEQKKLEITCQMQGNLPPFVLGDVTRLRQILVNLLSNAVKFTDQGEVQVSVSGEMRDDGLYQLHFVVRDTGPGIPSNRQNRLFLSFSQVDASTSRRFGGTGLGLAISKRLSEMMGGKIWVESSGVPGEGAAFHFTILVGTGAEPLLQETTNVVDLAGKQVLIVDDNNTIGQCHPLRILLAEDNLINQKVALKMLKKMGYRADVVSDGLEVLEALIRIPYNVILMDCQMPEMDGYEATRQIRAIEQRVQREPVYIIAMTAHALKGDREECLAAGMNDYLSKPVHEMELREALLRCQPISRHDNQNRNTGVSEHDVETGAENSANHAGDNTSATKNPHAQSTPIVEPLLDLEVLAETAEIGVEEMRELVELYRTQAKETILQLRQAIDAGEAENVDKLAHKLAGSSSVCGAQAMTSVLRALEKQGHEGQLSQAKELFTEVCQRLELTEQALSDYLEDMQDH